ncbi:MAG: hypothetical protein EOP49_07180, partial [Sphingobacteriales bacterium]
MFPFLPAGSVADPRFRPVRAAFARAKTLAMSAVVLLSSVTARAQFYQSSYTGTGAAQTISMPGVTPSLVIVKHGTGAVASIVLMNGMSNAQTFGYYLSATSDVHTPGSITTLGPSGFSVGTNNSVNGSGSTYHYLAARNLPGSIITGSYTGNGIDNRDITGLGFAPDWVMVIGVNLVDGAIFRTSVMPADYSTNFGSTNGANMIQSFGTGSFQIGTHASVNTTGVQYYYIAAKADAVQFAVGTYTGNSTAGTALALPFSADAVSIKVAAGFTSAFRYSTIPAASDVTLAHTNNGPSTSRITALNASGAVLGTSA